MARTSMADVLSLPDSAQSWNWDLFIPTIPGSSIDPKLLTFKCKSTEIPGFAIEPVDISLHGVKKQEAGRATYTNTWSSTFIETIDYSTYLAFRGWRKYMRDWKNNTGTNSSAYKKNLELDLFDNAGNIGQTSILCGAWPQEIQAVQLDGSQSAVVEMSVTWSFDYVSDSTGW
jgi:hypothetical protein